MPGGNDKKRQLICENYRAIFGYRVLLRDLVREKKVRQCQHRERDFHFCPDCGLPMFLTKYEFDPRFIEWRKGEADPQLIFPGTNFDVLDTLPGDHDRRLFTKEQVDSNYVFIGRAAPLAHLITDSRLDLWTVDIAGLVDDAVEKVLRQYLLPLIGWHTSSFGVHYIVQRSPFCHS